MSNGEETEGEAHAHAKRVNRAAERLRELKASGVELLEILCGPAGVKFVLDDCEGDPDLAYAAFALAHSTISQSER